MSVEGYACCMTVKVSYLSCTPLLCIGSCFDILLQPVLSAEITPDEHIVILLPFSHTSSCISMTPKVMHNMNITKSDNIVTDTI